MELMWSNLADADGDGENYGLADPNNIGNFEVASYWSSSEDVSEYAWNKDFAFGGTGQHSPTYG